MRFIDIQNIDKEEYIGYCKMACLPLDHPTEKGGGEE